MTNRVVLPCKEQVLKNLGVAHKYWERLDNVSFFYIKCPHVGIVKVYNDEEMKALTVAKGSTAEDYVEFYVIEEFKAAHNSCWSKRLCWLNNPLFKKLEIEELMRRATSDQVGNH